MMFSNSSGLARAMSCSRMAKQKTSRSCFCWRSTAGLNQPSPNLTSAGGEILLGQQQKCHCAASAWLGSGCSPLLPLADQTAASPLA